MLKSKKIKILKKLISIIGIILMIIQYIQPVTLAVSGNGNWIGGQFDSHIRTTDDTGEYGMLIRRITNKDTNEAYTVFCAENHVPFKTGVVVNGDYYTPTDPTLKRACKVAYFGWFIHHGSYVANGGLNNPGFEEVKLAYVFTQQLIWETLGQSNATFIDPAIQSRYVSFKNDINNQINAIETKPSFNRSTITLEIGKPNVVTDTNGVLQEYNTIDKTDNGIRFQHNKGENTLTITANENCNIGEYRLTDEVAKSWGLFRAGTEDNDTTIYFEFDAGVQNQLVALNYNDPVALDFSIKINLYGNLEIVKTNTKGNLIDGSVFNLKSVDGTYNQNHTVTGGRITIEKLKPTDYILTEISAPEGYLLDTTKYNITIKSGQTVSKTIVNKEPTGTIKVTKVDRETDKNQAQGIGTLEGAEYSLYAKTDIYNKARTVKYYSKDQIVATHKTNANGIMPDFIELPIGSYYLKETKNPLGYLKDNKTYDVNITYGGQTVNVVVNSIKVSDEIIKGKIKVIKLDAKTGEKVTYKSSQFGIYASCDMKIENKNYKTGELIQTLDTRNGEAISKDLPYGEYYIKEIKAPEKYILNPTPSNIARVEANENIYTIEIANEVKTGTAKLTKSFDNTVTGLTGDAIIVGAKYVMYADENIINPATGEILYNKDEKISPKQIGKSIWGDEGEKTTDANGNITWTNLPLGKYRVVEEKASEGCLLNTEKLTYNLTEKTPNVEEKIEISNSTKEKIMEQKIDIFKEGIGDTNHSSGEITGLNGATFVIKLKQDVDKLGWNNAPIYDEVTTATNGDGQTGYAITEPLPYGVYIMKETVTPKGYVTSPDIIFNVTQDEIHTEGSEKRIVINDELMSAYIKIIKRDAKTEKIVSLNGATFKIKDLSTNEYVTQKVGSTKYSLFTTNNENMIVLDDNYINKNDTLGTVITPLKLSVGDYEIEEIITPKGFLQLEKPVKFTIGDVIDLTKDEDGDVIIEVNVYNEQPTAEIIVEKTIEKYNTDTDLVNRTGLSGIKFELSAKNDVISAIDGSVIYKAGEKIEEYNLDKEGNLKIDNLPMGLDETIYQLKEIETLDGLVLDDEIHEFTFKQEDLTTKKYTLNKDIINYPTQISLSKTDVTGEAELEGATIQVLDIEGNVIDEWISGKEPHTIQGLKVNEKYIMIEKVAVEGYVKATNIEFIIENTKEMQKVTMVDKIVSVKKTDFVTGDEIPGAELEITDKEGNIIDKWTSTDEEHIVIGLEEGQEYTLTEETCPYGFKQAESITFTVSKEKENQLIEMKDMPILKTIRVIKADSNTKETIKEDFTFGIFEDEQCTKLIREVESNKDDGTVTFEDLRFGEFFIKELKAPNGYQLSDKVIKIEINDKGTFADSEQLEDIDSVCSFTFYNEHIPEIQTGNEINYILLASCALISLLGIITCIIVIAKRK